MNAFKVELKNKPGELARITEVVAQKGINITGFTGASCGDSGTIFLLTNDEIGTRKAFADAHVKAHEVELVSVALQDAPGSLAEAARRLANAGVNIEGALPTGMAGGKITIAFATSDPTKARSVLSQLELVGSSR